MSSRFAILNPCSRKWTDLDGNGRSRYCDVCRTHVHAIEEYSNEDWSQVWRESNGHVCGYLTPPPATAPRSRRAVLFGALLTMVSPLMAQSGRVRIRVVDQSGAVIPRAEVSLLGADNKAARTLETNAVGVVTWTDLQIGNHRFTVERMGFQQLFLTVIATSNSEAQLDAVLEVGTVGGAVTVPYVTSKSTGEIEPARAPAKKAKRKRWLLF